jgi:hypothetical protein
MTSTDSSALKNQNQHALYTLSYFLGIRNLSGLNDLNSLSGLKDLKDLNSLISTKKLLSFGFSINPGTKMAYSALLMWDGS